MFTLWAPVSAALPHFNKIARITMDLWNFSASFATDFDFSISLYAEMSQSPTIAFKSLHSLCTSFSLFCLFLGWVCLCVFMIFFSIKCLCWLEIYLIDLIYTLKHRIYLRLSINCFHFCLISALFSYPLQFFYVLRQIFLPFFHPMKKSRI